MTTPKLKRAVSVDELLKKKFNVMKFVLNWLLSFGTPERSGSWIIWGMSGNGKTRFTLQLAKYLSGFGKVAYMTLEEGAKLSFQRAIAQTNMISVAKKFVILEGETIEELTQRLLKRKSPDIIIIDSVQYWEINKSQYKQLKAQFPNKLFIFISHAEGKEPMGSTAKSIRYDADVKIWVQGYKAFPVSRFGGGRPFTIWEEGADEYWSKNN